LKYMGWNFLTPVKEFAPGVVSMKVENTGVIITMKPGSYPWPENIV
jgi:D-threonate/D-erythronate kinase